MENVIVVDKIGKTK